MRILVVEDDDNTRTGLVEILTLEGFEVTAVASAEAAANMLNLDFSIVLTDLRLPGGSGLDLIKNVRQTGREVFCILMTAFSTPESYLEGKNLGVNAWLNKPISIDKLLSLLQMFDSVPI